MKGGRAAVFLDRDGTLMVDGGYVGDPSGVRLLPTVARALVRLRDAHYERIVVSNQSGIARGMFDEAAVERVDVELRGQLAAEGAELDAIYRCPHLDDGCDCRKPLPGMLLRAMRERDLDASRCVMVGDRGTDVAAGHAAGLPSVLVTTGPLRYDGPRPEKIASTLDEAARWITERDA